MSLENTNLSRRKLLKASAIGVPAAGMLAFGSTLVTATSANAIETDGWWGSETSSGLQQFMNAVVDAGLTVDGVISSQPSSMAPNCPGIVGGWEWVDGAAGSPTIQAMNAWLKHLPYNSPLWGDGSGLQGQCFWHDHHSRDQKPTGTLRHHAGRSSRRSLPNHHGPAERN